jgi:hypothetical protein
MGKYMLANRVIPWLGKRIAAVAVSCVVGVTATGAMSLRGEHSTHVETDSLATITTDTGAFSPGNKNFSRYTPWMCVAAVHQEQQVIHRSLSDLNHYEWLQVFAPERDTIAMAARTIAQKCERRFLLSKSPSTDLPALFTLALMAGHDSLARTVLLRQLAEAKDSAQRQKVLADAVDGYVKAEPARLADATWAADKADSFALAEHANSLPVHLPLLYSASLAFDQPRLRAEARRILALGKQLDFHAIRYEDVPLIMAWMEVCKVAFVEHPDSVLALVQQAKTDLSRFPLGPTFPPGITWTPWQAFDFAHASIPRVRNFMLPFNPDRYQGPNAFPAIDAQYWFPSAPKLWPPHGAVTLVLYDFGCVRGPVVEPRFGPQNVCALFNSTIPEWQAKYGSQFELTVVEVTAGHVLRGNVLTSAQEADSIAWYYRTYKKDSATRVAVVRGAQMEIVPSPDGRQAHWDSTALGRELQEIRIGRDLPPWKNDNTKMALLFDKDGRLLFVGNPNNYFALIDVLIARSVKTKTTASTTPFSLHVRYNHG